MGFSLNGAMYHEMKLVDQLIDLGSNISSTEA